MHAHEKHVHLTYIAYLCYPVKTEHHISSFYTFFILLYFDIALLEYYPLHQAWCETSSSSSTQNKLTVTSYVQHVHHWQEYKHTSVLAIGHLCHQSVTAPSLVTHAGDAVAGHQCHERDIDVISTSCAK